MTLKISALLAVMLLCWGCRETEEKPAQLDGPISGLDGDFLADGGAAMVTLHSTLLDADTGANLQSASICLLENGAKGSSCVQSDSSGKFSISVPAAVETGIFIDHSGNKSTFVPLVTSKDITLPDLLLFTETYLQGQHTKLGLSYPTPAKGQIWVNGTSGATLPALTGAEGPYYINAAEDLDGTAQAIMEPFLLGAYLDVSPAEHDVQISQTGKTCQVRLGLGWDSTSAVMKVPVFAGYASLVAASCN